MEAIYHKLVWIFIDLLSLKWIIFLNSAMIYNLSLQFFQFLYLFFQKDVSQIGKFEEYMVRCAKR